MDAKEPLQDSQKANEGQNKEQATAAAAIFHFDFFSRHDVSPTLL
jgi:hypothetical protein